MKLISAKQKNTTSDPPERINFSNEIEVIGLSSNMTFRLSDFRSDIIYFYRKGGKSNITIRIQCDRPLRKYTFVALNDSNSINIEFEFYAADGDWIEKYSNATDFIFKAGTSGVIDLYQTAEKAIHLVQHTLSPI